jgi:hypothetical protein
MNQKQELKLIIEQLNDEKLVTRKRELENNI